MMDKNLSLILINQELMKKEEHFFKISRVSLRVVIIFSLIILVSTIVG